jgi:ribose 5-phosphate isomerase A
MLPCGRPPFLAPCPRPASIEIDVLKAAAAEAATSLVEDGQVVGLGSGSTALLALGFLGKRVLHGLQIIGIPTSERTAREARRLGIPLSTLAEHDHIDVTVDGADEVVVDNLDLLKGRGGALLREKIVASISERLVVVVDETKLVDRLCSHGPLAVEVVPFGWHPTAKKLQRLGANVTRRATRERQPFVTDEGNYILDCAFDAIDDPEWLSAQLDRMVGVVEHGLLLGLVPRVLVGTGRGVQLLDSTRSREPTSG